MPLRCYIIKLTLRGCVYIWWRCYISSNTSYGELFKPFKCNTWTIYKSNKYFNKGNKLWQWINRIHKSRFSAVPNITCREANYNKEWPLLYGSVSVWWQWAYGGKVEYEFHWITLSLLCHAGQFFRIILAKYPCIKKELALLAGGSTLKPF